MDELTRLEGLMQLRYSV